MRTGSDVCLRYYRRTVYLVFCRQPYFLLLLWRFGRFFGQQPPQSPSSNLSLPAISFIWSNLRYLTSSRLFIVVYSPPPPPPSFKRLKTCKVYCVGVCVCMRACPVLLEEPKILFQSDHSYWCLEPINMMCSVCIFFIDVFRGQLTHAHKTHTKFY